MNATTGQQSSPAYRFNRGEKAVEWAEKNIKKVFMNLNTKKLRNV